MQKVVFGVRAWQRLTPGLPMLSVVTPMRRALCSKEYAGGGCSVATHICKMLCSKAAKQNCKMLCNSQEKIDVVNPRICLREAERASAL